METRVKGLFDTFEVQGRSSGPSPSPAVSKICMVACYGGTNPKGNNLVSIQEAIERKTHRTFRLTA